MSLVVPSVDGFQRIRIGLAIYHSFRLFIGYIIGYGAIDINKIVLDITLQHWA